MPGESPRTGARLVAAWREDRDRFASAEAVQALVGTSPVAYQRRKLGRVQLCRACAYYFRQTLHRLAFASLRPCGWVCADAAARRARGHGHPAVLRAWANRRGQMLFGMWNDQAPYARAQFWAAQARHRTA
ncbi:MAG: transposase [Firmicutes bacterium]|nr:transposase [Alicyclobacillaceae bacterium]MCL6497387.1 transposase [Bacillota bacterium]